MIFCPSKNNPISIPEYPSMGDTASWPPGWRSSRILRETTHVLSARTQFAKVYLDIQAFFENGLWRGDRVWRTWYWQPKLTSTTDSRSSGPTFRNGRGSLSTS